VTVGNASPSTGSNPAQPGSDLATGSGLVDAFQALLAIAPPTPPNAPPDTIKSH